MTYRRCVKVKNRNNIHANILINKLTLYYSGRRSSCVLYAVLYVAACITKHFANFWILITGRIFGGIATSILYSAFESWLVCEHNKVLFFSFPTSINLQLF